MMGSQKIMYNGRVRARTRIPSPVGFVDRPRAAGEVSGRNRTGTRVTPARMSEIQKIHLHPAGATNPAIKGANCGPAVVIAIDKAIVLPRASGDW